MKWEIFEKVKDIQSNEAPYDSKPFLACIWGEWVGMAIYLRHYDCSETRKPRKYDFFYVIDDPEEGSWQFTIEENPFPITHWMPLPNSPKENK